MKDKIKLEKLKNILNEMQEDCNLYIKYGDCNKCKFYCNIKNAMRAIE